MQAVKLVCLLSFLALALGQPKVLQIDFDGAFADDDVDMSYNSIVEIDFTYIETDEEDNVLLNPLNQTFDLIVVSREDDFDFGDESTEDQQTIRSNIENYANNGGVFVLTGYDAISDDDILPSILGGTSTDDCTSVGAFETEDFSENPLCDPLFNQIFDIRGITPETKFLKGMEDIDDEDCLVIGEGDAIPCWEFEDTALFSIRHMENNGAIVWFSSDEDDYDEVQEGFYQLVYANLLAYASGNTYNFEKEQNILTVSTQTYLSSIQRGIDLEAVGIRHESTNFDENFYFLSPISSEHKMVIFNKSDDDLDEEFDQENRETIKANIENYANQGGAFVMTGYDMIASSTDDLLIDILGGTSSNDCFVREGEGEGEGEGEIPIGSFSTNAVCDPLLNCLVDIRGEDGSINLTEAMGDEDCLVIGEGDSAVSCLDHTSGSLFSIRPMRNGGAIIWLSADRIKPSVGRVGNFAVNNYYQIILNNLANCYVILSYCERTIENNPPEYECGTSLTIYTDRLCEGKQCAAIPELDLGFCYDPEGCDCVITKTSGPNKGDEVTAGIYEVYSEAEDSHGNKSDLCSFRVYVENSCDEEGPKMICPEQDIQLSVRSSCSVGDSKCAKMPPVFMGACSTSEKCSCTVRQESGPSEGEALVPGEYFVVSSATDAIGLQSSTKCSRKIVVN